MAYDEKLAGRVRTVLAGTRSLTEKKMFGGLAFMVRGHMCCGVEKDRLMVRVGPEQYETTLKRTHAREMDFTGRPLRGFVYVLPTGIKRQESLRQWIDMGLSYVSALPKK